MTHVVVLGGGVSGEHFVGGLRRLDKAVTITVVERRLVGGECSYWACMPTKTMLRAPELVAAATHSDGAVSGANGDAQRILVWRDWVAGRGRQADPGVRRLGPRGVRHFAGPVARPVDRETRTRPRDRHRSRCRHGR